MPTLGFQNTLNELENARLKALIITVIAFIAVFAVATLIRYLFHLGIFGSIIVYFFPAMLVFVISAAFFQPYIEKFNRDFVKSYLSANVPELKLYTEEKNKNGSVHFSMGAIFLTLPSEFACDYTIKNNDNKINVTCSQITVKTEVMKQSTKGSIESRSSNKTLFKGLFFILEDSVCLKNETQYDWDIMVASRNNTTGIFADSFTIVNTPSSQQVEFIRNKSRLVIRDSEEQIIISFPPAGTYTFSRTASCRIETDDRKFNELFSVFANNSNVKSIIKDPLIRQKIMDIQERWNSDMYISVTGGRMYVALRYSKKIDMDPPLFFPINKRKELELSRNIETIVSMIKAAGELAEEVNKHPLPQIKQKAEK